ncbi:unnamed protein product [Cylicocyclus nassatus]|uniref:Uncharacterized protein n=1 Tax=Cylicocyclus nassatus TaxID=53992 RepID=A0AA36H1I3_CYLNA|nr:unnamed protein product [Cylicocyclus nassatus]
MNKFRNVADMPVLLVGTKDTLLEKNPRVISEEEGKQMENHLKRCAYYETCATYGLNVERVFKDEDVPHILDPKRMRIHPSVTSTTSSLFSERLGESSRDQDSDRTHHSLASIGEAQDVEVQSPHAVVAGPHATQNLPCSETLVYMANFALHFGVTSAMESYLDDLQELSIASSAKYTFKSDVNFLKSELFHPYKYTHYYFCNGCSGPLRDQTSKCNKAGCCLRGFDAAPKHRFGADHNYCSLTPKRSHLARRASLHLVNIAPQLLLVLRNTIDQLVETHKHIHEETAHAFLSETSDFGLYREDMETHEEFSSKRLNVILTLNTDGVTFKKLTKSQAWPLYVRLEGLAHAQKNSFENMILPGILFTSKTPSRVMLEHLLSRFKRELLALSDQGLDISDRHGSVWKVTPILKNGIVDFSVRTAVVIPQTFSFIRQALHILFNSPVWNAEHGCHLCTFAGLKVENRIVWYNENASPAIRRTRASILRDASAELNGLSG